MTILFSSSRCLFGELQGWCPQEIRVENKLTGTPLNEPHKTNKHAELVLPIPNQGQKILRFYWHPKEDISGEGRSDKTGRSICPSGAR